MMNGIGCQCWFGRKLSPEAQNLGKPGFLGYKRTIRQRFSSRTDSNLLAYQRWLATGFAASINPQRSSEASMATQQSQFSQETDELVDSESFSGFSLVGLIASLVGILSLSYVHFMPFAIIGTVLGMFVLLFAKKMGLSKLSKIFAFLAVALGATCASWGLSASFLHSNYELVQARKVAELYLNALSKGDLDSVYYLVGFQHESERRPGDDAPETELRKAKNRLAVDPAHVAIQKRRGSAKWTFVSLDGEAIGTAGYSYKLKYRDDGQTNPLSYFVYARKDVQERFATKKEIHWYVDTVEAVK